MGDKSPRNKDKRKRSSTIAKLTSTTVPGRTGSGRTVASQTIQTGKPAKGADQTLHAVFLQ